MGREEAGWEYKKAKPIHLYRRLVDNVLGKSSKQCQYEHVISNMRERGKNRRKTSKEFKFYGKEWERN